MDTIYADENGSNFYGYKFENNKWIDYSYKNFDQWHDYDINDMLFDNNLTYYLGSYLITKTLWDDQHTQINYYRTFFPGHDTLYKKMKFRRFCKVGSDIWIQNLLLDSSNLAYLYKYNSGTFTAYDSATIGLDLDFWYELNVGMLSDKIIISGYTMTE